MKIDQDEEAGRKSEDVKDSKEQVQAIRETSLIVLEVLHELDSLFDRVTNEHRSCE
jgi:hypothetical protein